MVVCCSWCRDDERLKSYFSELKDQLSMQVFYSENKRNIRLVLRVSTHSAHLLDRLDLAVDSRTLNHPSRDPRLITHPPKVPFRIIP
jgi:hypothetical protein